MFFDVCIVKISNLVCAFICVLMFLSYVKARCNLIKAKSTAKYKKIAKIYLFR